MGRKFNKINSFDYNNKDKIYTTINGHNFKVVDKKTEKKITSTGKTRWNTKYLVHFIKTGYEKWCDTKEINIGTIKDWYDADVCGIGVVGKELDHPQSHYLYDRWYGMISRCYNKNDELYDSYGGRGVTVCDEWLYFPNYIKDIETKENYEKLKVTHKNVNDRYEIDKDLIKKGNKIYCNEYTCIVPHQINLKERNERNNYNKNVNSLKVVQIDFEFKFIKIHNSISDAYREIKNIKDNGIHINASGIVNCCKRNSITSLGYLWCYYDENKTIETHIKELKEYVYTYYNKLNNLEKSKLINKGIKF